MTASEQATKLKNDLSAVIGPLLAAFHRDTGLMPAAITVHMQDMTSMSSPKREYVFTGVGLEFRI